MVFLSRSVANRILTSFFWVACGLALAPAAALAEVTLSVKSVEPQAESPLTILNPPQVLKEEKSKKNIEWYGTGGIKIGPWESLVLVKDQRGVELQRSKTDDSVYSVRVQLLGQNTSFEMVRVLADGRAQTIFLEFNYPEYEEQNPNGDKLMELDPLKSTVTLGFTSFVYRDSRFDNFSSIAMTLKASNRLELMPGKLDLGTSFFLNLFPLSKSDPNRTARTLGINVRVGRTVFKKVDQSVRINLGVYYTTMLVSPQTFGFQDLMGPQFFPTYSRSFTFGVFATYLKFSPIGVGAALAPFSNREIGWGLSWTRPHNKEFNLFFTFDVANINATIQNIFVSNTSLTLAGGVEF